MQNGKQQVLFADVCGSLDTCLKHSEFQDIIRFFIENQFVGVDGHSQLILTYLVLKFCLDGL